MTYFPSGAFIQKGVPCQILEYLQVSLPDDGAVYLLSEAEADGFLAFSYKIQSIQSPSGEDVMHLYNESSHQITFPEVGSYTFEVYIRDSKKKESRLLVDVPVDR